MNSSTDHSVGVSFHTVDLSPRHGGGALVGASCTVELDDANWRDLRSLIRQPLSATDDWTMLRDVAAQLRHAVPNHLKEMKEMAAALEEASTLVFEYQSAQTLRRGENNRALGASVVGRNNLKRKRDKSRALVSSFEREKFTAQAALDDSVAALQAANRCLRLQNDASLDVALTTFDFDMFSHAWADDGGRGGGEGDLGPVPGPESRIAGISYGRLHTHAHSILNPCTR